MLRRLFAGSLVVLMSATMLFAHGDATHILGTITAIQADHITVRSQDGKTTQMVMLDKATKYLSGEKPAKKGDLKVGTRVVIDAKMDTKMKMYSALEVRIGVTETHENHK